MRSLIGLLVLWVSVEASAYSTAQFEFVTGRTLRGEIEGPPLLRRSTMSYTNSNVFGGVASQVSVAEAKFDYSPVTLINSQGLQSALDFNKSEFLASIGLSRASRQLTLLGSASGHVFEAPYATRSQSLGAEYMLRENVSRLGFRFLSTQLQQPFSYFIDPKTAQTRQRSLILNTQVYEVYHEEIWSSEFKGFYSILYGERFEDRPPHIGIETRHSRSLSSKLSARIDFGLKAEQTDSEPKDDRGPMSVWWAEALTTYQPNFRWQAAVGVGTLVERERVIVDQSTIVRGVDSIMIRGQHVSKGLTVGGELRGSFTNRDQFGVGFKGVFTWSI